MISPPGPTEVLEELGDKFVTAISVAVAMTQSDQLVYRQQHPLFAAAQSVGGWAYWIHDQLWKNLVAHVEDLPGVSIRDDQPQPTREIFVGLRYRVRVKRHDVKGGVATYPTPHARRLFRQRQETLDGIQEVVLCVGYTWDNLTNSIKEPILSLPRDIRRAEWLQALLPAEADGATGVYTLRSAPEPAGPVAPMIDFPGDEQTEEKQA